MDFQSAMETFAEAWVAANTKTEGGGDPGLAVQNSIQSQALALTHPCKSPSGTPVRIGSHGPSVEPRTPQPRTPHGDRDGLPNVSPKKEAGFDMSKNASAKSLPVHCVVEGVSALDDSSPRRRPAVETDSYVIIPAATAFHELVTAALVRLGYSQDAAAAAKGSVVIKNWKPLPFERISDGPLATVGEILGELTTVATIRIQVLRPRASPLQDIKDKLLRLLLAHSHGLLMSTGCPLDEMTLAQLCRNQLCTPGPHGFHEPSDEVKRQFEHWWNAQINPRPSPFSPRQASSPASKLDRTPSVTTLPEHVHPALQTVQNQYPTQKTRMRTSFDPELELPKLQRWFSENQHPSRQQIQHYVRELNGLDSRRGRKPLDVNNVVYWFKNARAAQKRAELRNIGPGGIPCHLSLNGYNSSSHSPPNGSMMMPHEYLSSDRLSEHHSLKSPISESPGRGPPLSIMSEDNLSNNGSDIEDDELIDDVREEQRSESPEAPLSLCMAKRDRSVSPKRGDAPKVDSIKQEPDMDDTPKTPNRSPVNHNNNHLINNNGKESSENNISEDEEDDEGDNEEHENGVKIRRLSDESLPTMHPGRVADMNRQQMHQFRSPSPSDVIGGGQLIPRTPGNLDRLTAAGFPLVPNPMFSHSIMYMSHYIPGLTQGNRSLPGASPPGSSGLNLSALAASAADERRKRNRTFIDPVTEVPRLEQWFSLNTHPSHSLILKYTEELNRMPYRQKFPRLESKNVQFWFKNRRAKCKRLKMSLYEPGPPGSMPQYHVNDRD